jgi:hypothetical protein
MDQLGAGWLLLLQFLDISWQVWVAIAFLLLLIIYPLATGRAKPAGRGDMGPFHDDRDEENGHEGREVRGREAAVTEGLTDTPGPNQPGRR